MNVLKNITKFEIFLLVVEIFAFAYLANSAFSQIEIVSAQENSDSENSADPPELVDPEWAEANQITDEDLNTAYDNLNNQGIEIPPADASQEDKLAAAEQIRNQASGQESMADWFKNTFVKLWDMFIETIGNGISAGGFLQSVIDDSGGVSICPMSENGESCLKFTGNECDEFCSEPCIDITNGYGDLPEDSVCRLGTCYDEEYGTCQTRSPKGTCDTDGGTWYNDEFGNVDVCQMGCCMLGDEPLFATQGSCNLSAESYGLSFGGGATWEDGVTQGACLARAYANFEGACVIPLANDEENRNSCQFTTGDICGSLGGNFYPDELCSSDDPKINSVCEKQFSTGCADSLSGVYWFDSCGNRENIFEGNNQSQKDEAWNGGKVKLLGEEVCSLGDSNDPFANQESCGNCNNLLSSNCGVEDEDHELDDGEGEADGGVICRDLRCEENGRTYESGESWCAYQSSIGLPGIDNPDFDLAVDLASDYIPSNPFTKLVFDGERSTDTPGSLHFRKSCLNGNVSITPCDDNRNFICEEKQTEKNAGGTISSATCRESRWQECLAYNPSQIEARIIGSLGSPRAADLLDAKLKLTCGVDPDCFVKTVDMTEGGDDNFKFSYCAPRYAPGFDLREKEDTQTICSQASQTCTYVEVKMLEGGWECKLNCKCKEDQESFGQQMNALCTSLGDCGASVNYVGTPGFGGYSITETEGDSKHPKDVSSLLGFGGQGSLNALMWAGDANPTPGEYVPSAPDYIGKSIGKWTEGVFGFTGSFGGDQMFGGDGGEGAYADAVGDPEAGAGIQLGAISGATGAAALGAAYAFPATTVTGAYMLLPQGVLVPGGGAVVASSGLPAIPGTMATETLAVPISEVGSAPAAGAMGFAGAALGAAAGAALTGFLIDALGIGIGLGPAATYTLVGAGAVGGAIAGYQAATGGWAAVGANPIGVVILVVVIVVIIILKVMGVGEVREIKVNFECKPWTAPSGGNCGLCGTDGLSDGTDKFPCTKYSCEALGQDCEFISASEGFDGGQCIKSEQRDSSYPKIESLIPYEGIEYYEDEDLNTVFGIRKENGECFTQFEPFNIGFITDEPAQSCKIGFEGQYTSIAEVPKPLCSSNQNNGLKCESGNIRFFELGRDLGLDLGESGDKSFSFDLVCEDYHEISNYANPIKIKTCVNPLDLSPPLITLGEKNVDLPFETDETKITFNVDRPGEYRCDNQDVDFDEMEIDAVCNQQTLICTCDIVISGDSTPVYIRGKDHPEWIGTDKEENRNENPASVDLNIERSKSALSIDSINVDGQNYTDNVEPVRLEIEVKTSGGVDGTADCQYKIDDYSFDIFGETGGTTHTDTPDSIYQGDHVLQVNCVDAATNTATRTANFGIVVDKTIPEITRIYGESGFLYIVTNEKGLCGYSHTKCDFDVGEEGSNSFSEVGGLTHWTNLDVGETYFVKCEDEYGNENPGICEQIQGGGL